MKNKGNAADTHIVVDGDGNVSSKTTITTEDGLLTIDHVAEDQFSRRMRLRDKTRTAYPANAYIVRCTNIAALEAHLEANPPVSPLQVILRALAHVIGLHLSVTHVYFTPELHWRFIGPDNFGPFFGTQVNMAWLEEAAQAAVEIDLVSRPIFLIESPEAKDDWEADTLLPPGLNSVMRNILDPALFLQEFPPEEPMVCNVEVGNALPKANRHDRRMRGARRRIDTLENVLSELYQVLGELDAPEKVLDQVTAALEGAVLPHESLLPFVKGEQ
jgi:hypothetical protein